MTSSWPWQWLNCRTSVSTSLSNFPNFPRINDLGTQEILGSKRRDGEEGDVYEYLYVPNLNPESSDFSHSVTLYAICLSLSSPLPTISMTFGGDGDWEFDFGVLRQGWRETDSSPEPSVYPRGYAILKRTFFLSFPQFSRDFEEFPTTQFPVLKCRSEGDEDDGMAERERKNRGITNR